MWKYLVNLVATKAGIAIIASLVVGIISAVIISQHLQIKNLTKLYENMTKDYLLCNVKKQFVEDNLANCNSVLDTQNKAIKNLEVDLSNVTKEKDRAAKKLRNIKTPKSDDNCSSKVKYYEDLFRGLSAERGRYENRSIQTTAG